MMLCWCERSLPAVVVPHACATDGASSMCSCGEAAAVGVAGVDADVLTTSTASGEPVGDTMGLAAEDAVELLESLLRDCSCWLSR